jgi:hypothetical protein
VSILNGVTENSLALFDELGAGTDPIEGAALAQSILESILSKNALCASTTHYAELKAFALNTENVSNASCEFDINTLKPTYRLIIGAPGKSNAFLISQKLGVPESVVSRAMALTSDDSKSFEAVIEKLKGKNVYLTVDLDVLDPSVFPGTGTPEAGGVTFDELRKALTLVCEKLNIVACDVNELSPQYDQSGVSTAVACKIIREMLLAMS